MIVVVLGAFLGISIQVLTPWSSIVMHQINAAFANPLISGNPGLALMLTFLGFFAAYLFLPIFGIAGGLFLHSST